MPCAALLKGTKKAQKRYKNSGQMAGVEAGIN